jgi:leucyl aminopeptidase
VSVKKDVKTSDIENLGAKFHGHINYDKEKKLFCKADTVNSNIENLLDIFCMV